MKRCLLAVLFLFPAGIQYGQSHDERSPSDIARVLVDRTVRETSFELRRVPQTPVLSIHVIDYGSVFGPVTRGIAYAHAALEVERDTVLSFGLSHDLPVIIRLNGNEVFTRVPGPKLMFREVGYETFAFEDTVRWVLKKGRNAMFIKGEISTRQNVCYLRELPAPRQRPFSRFVPADSTSAASVSPWRYAGVFGMYAGASLRNIFPPDSGFRTEYFSEGTAVLWKAQPPQSVYELAIRPDAAYRREPLAEWQYPSGALLLAMLNYARGRRDSSIRDFVHRCCDISIDHQELFRTQYERQHAFRGTNHRFFRRSMLDDTGAPVLPFVELKLRTGESRYDTVIQEIAQYVSHEQTRLSDGTLCRSEPYPETIWADDLFMSVPFLSREYLLTGVESYLDDAVRQVVRFNAYLKDSNTGLYRHGCYDAGTVQSSVCWGRANGWVVWAESELLQVLPLNHPQRAEIEKIYGEHLNAIAKFQAPSGLWHQILDRPDSFEETSCTAMFMIAIARGISNGILDSTYIEPLRKAMSGLQTKISRDGIVKDICRGTELNESIQFYMTRERYDNDPRGLGAVITACMEMVPFVK